MEIRAETTKAQGASKDNGDLRSLEPRWCGRRTQSYTKQATQLVSDRQFQSQDKRNKTCRRRKRSAAPRPLEAGARQAHEAAGTRGTV
ncbi:hypothetical protein VTN00DRAFT_398 [Thermoascus crustaceus]|uniref:uncharacterized protein n=1 Tax=Thermoascus crustaceus TaxID=5088 RepID=UPI0037427316